MGGFMQVNNELTKNDFVSVLECHWFVSVNKTFSYKSLYNSKVSYCDDCGLLYSDKILNENDKKISDKVFIIHSYC